MKTSTSVGSFPAMIMLAVLPFVIYWAAQRGLAEVVAQEPRYAVNLWRSGKLQPDAAKFDAMLAEMTKARDLDPSNPNLLEDLGRFHAVRVERGKPYDPEVRAVRQQALQRFRQVLELRPTSGHAWINVALMKFRLGELDQEYSAALEQALRRSPWEPHLQLLAIELGVASWQVLSVPMQLTLERNIRAQGGWRLVNQKPALQALFKRYKRSDLVCLLDERSTTPCGAS